VHHVQAALAGLQSLQQGVAHQCRAASHLEDAAPGQLSGTSMRSLQVSCPLPGGGQKAGQSPGVQGVLQQGMSHRPCADVCVQTTRTGPAGYSGVSLFLLLARFWLVPSDMLGHVRSSRFCRHTQRGHLLPHTCAEVDCKVQALG
jgi:hypothetical protein